MSNFRDLLNSTKSEIREVDTASAEEERRAGALLLDVREADEFEQGAVPGSVFIPRGHLESQVEGRILDKSDPGDRDVRRGNSLRVRCQDAGELGYTDVVSMAGGFGKWKNEGRDWMTPRRPHARAAQPLPAPPAAARGRRGGPAEAARGQGAAARRRRARLTGRALPRRGRRRHARHRRHGRGRRVEPAAPDPPQHGPHRRPQGRLGEEDAHRAQPRRQRRHLRRAPRRRQHRSTSSTATTSSSTAPTTSRRATCSTTRR